MDPKFHNSGTFKNSGKSLQNENDVNTLLRLESPVSTIPFLNVTKRKWGSSSSATVKETNIDHSHKMFGNPNNIDLELSLSTGTSSQSDIDTYKRNKIRTGLFLDQIVKEIRPSSTTKAPISSITCTSEITNQPHSVNNSSIKVCQIIGCEKSEGGGICPKAKRSKKMLDFTKMAHGRGKRHAKADTYTDLYTDCGALVKDKRVHGGATLGDFVHDPKEEIDMNVNLMDWKKFNAKSLDFPIGYEAAPPALEGRVHGGSILALLSGPSKPVKILPKCI